MKQKFWEFYRGIPNPHSLPVHYSEKQLWPPQWQSLWPDCLVQWVHRAGFTHSYPTWGFQFLAVSLVVGVSISDNTSIPFLEWYKLSWPFLSCREWDPRSSQTTRAWASGWLVNKQVLASWLELERRKYPNDQRNLETEMILFTSAHLAVTFLVPGNLSLGQGCDTEIMWFPKFGPELLKIPVNFLGLVLSKSSLFDKLASIRCSWQGKQVSLSKIQNKTPYMSHITSLFWHKTTWPLYHGNRAHVGISSESVISMTPWKIQGGATRE